MEHEFLITLGPLNPLESFESNREAPSQLQPWPVNKSLLFFLFVFFYLRGFYLPRLARPALQKVPLIRPPPTKVTTDESGRNRGRGR